MKNFPVLVDAIEYIECKLLEPISQQDIAANCHVSLSSLQKLFRHAFRLTIKEYVSKRKLCCAARDLLDASLSVTQIAYHYGYNSPEVFTRAFAKVWGVTPSSFAGQWKFAGIFPRLTLDYEGGNDMPVRRTDISELYDLLKQAKDTIILCFDLMNLMGINEISREAGDLAILEGLRRLSDAAQGDMLVFRIGGDEFVIVTNTQDNKKAEAIAQKVLNQNGNPVEYKGQGIPVGMRCGFYRMAGNQRLKYDELFNDLQEAINETKR